MTEEVERQLEDLAKRLIRAKGMLAEMAKDHEVSGNTSEFRRLNGKASGVQLALGYLTETMENMRVEP